MFHGRVRIRAVFWVWLLGSLAILAVLYMWEIFPFARSVILTKNAYIRGHIAQVSANFSGVVTRVLVHDYDYVAKGQALAIGLSVEGRKKFDTLEKQKTILQKKLQSVAQLNRDERQKLSLQRQLKQVQGAIDYLEKHSNWQIIKAPIAGQVGVVHLTPGQRIAIDDYLLTIVPKDVWVVANFREADITQIKIGQKVSIHVNGPCPRELIGRVEYISKATGVAFSVLNRDDSTGNFVKITERIPVRIALIPHQQVCQLKPGMLVEVRVYTHEWIEKDDAK